MNVEGDDGLCAKVIAASDWSFEGKIALLGILLHTYNHTQITLCTINTKVSIIYTIFSKSPNLTSQCSLPDKPSMFASGEHFLLPPEM